MNKINILKEIVVALKKLNNESKKKDKSLYTLKYVYMVTFSINSIVTAFFSKILLDIYLKSNSQKNIAYYIFAFTIICCGMIWLSSYIREIARAKISYLRLDYLADAFDKIITTDYKYMEDSSFLNKYDSAFDACSSSESGIENVFNMLFEIPAYLVIWCAYIIIACFFSPVIVVAVFIHVIWGTVGKKNAKRYKYTMRERVSKINRKKMYFNKITQDFSYGKDIRLYSLQKLLLQKYELEIQKYKEILNRIKQKEFKYNALWSCTLLVVDLSIYGVLFFKAQGGLTISDITLYFIVISLLLEITTKLTNNISNIYGEGLFIVDYFKFINTELRNTHGDLCREDGLTCEIELRNFSFMYPNSNKYIYKNLNLKINTGEKVAIVGDNGVGKTTLIKVLTGLFRDFEGDILINGNSIKHMDTQSIYKLYSIVFQDINLLAYTIAENIACKSDQINEYDIWNILKVLGLKDKIESNKKGINQQVHKIIDKDGIEFSGGENQKIAIARALYKKGKILILDEPTSALDAIAEKNIYERFAEITENRTTIFISHRLASTKFCDRIYVLGENGIIEQGSHEELIKQKGVYYNTFMLQAKYYLENKDEKY